MLTAMPERNLYAQGGSQLTQPPPLPPPPPPPRSLLQELLFECDIKAQETMKKQRAGDGVLVHTKLNGQLIR